jgi:hypothetical protein
MSKDDSRHELESPYQQFHDLRALVAEELAAQLAIGRLGSIEPPPNGVQQVAGLIADAVVRVYRLERRSSMSEMREYERGQGWLLRVRCLWRVSAGRLELPLTFRDTLRSPCD